MNIIKFDIITSAFNVLCWAVSITVSVYWIHQYIQNEDLSIVNNKKFYQKRDDVFPVLSLCFKNPFPETYFENMGGKINTTDYVNFLKGQYHNDQLLTIDYRNASMDISEFVEEIYIKWKNGSYKYYSDKSYTKQAFERTYSGYGFFNIYEDIFYQCYGMNIPHESNIQVYSVSSQNEVFLRTFTPKEYDFMTLLHYPKQLLTSIRSIIYKWVKRSPEASTYISFRLTDMEVLHRRNKFDFPCSENWENYDQEIHEKHLADKGCRPPYLFSTKPFAPCVSVKEIKKSQFSIRADEYDTHPPCQSMDKIMFTYEEDDITGFPWAKPGHTWIGMNLFIDHFKMIEHTR